MKINTLFKRATNKATELLQTAQPVAKRVATVSGCMSLINELKELEINLERAPKGVGGLDTPEVHKRKALISRQKIEVRRVLLRRQFEEFADGVTKAVEDELKSAEAQIASLETGHRAAEADVVEVETKEEELRSRIRTLTVELDVARAEADKAVEEAKAALQAVFEQELGVDKEQRAAAALRKAQSARADAGTETELLIAGLNSRLSTLMTRTAGAKEKFQEVSTRLASAMVLRHEIRCDMAARVLIETMATGAAAMSHLTPHLPRTDVESLGYAKASDSKFTFYAEHRLPAGESLVYNGVFVGFDTLVQALSKEPDLALLAGIEEPTSSDSAGHSDKGAGVIATVVAVD